MRCALYDPVRTGTQPCYVVAVCGRVGCAVAGGDESPNSNTECGLN